MPILAIFTYEIRGLAASWLVRGWLIATALVALLAATSVLERDDPVPVIAGLLFSYLVFPWVLVVIMLGINPTTGSRLDTLADGILCRPVTRFEYLLASWGARVVVVLAVYLAVMVPVIAFVALARRKVIEQPITWYGAVASLAVVALVLAFVVTLAFLAGTVMRKPLLAATVLVFVWFPINVVLYQFSLEEFSPISLSQALPTLLRTPWSEPDEGSSDELKSDDVKALARQMEQFMRTFSSGMSQPARTSEPPRKEGFFEKGDYEDFSLVRVGLGYGIPMLLALVLAIGIFHWRDL